jgi:4-carboxymuconolactone decarboxylase
MDAYERGMKVRREVLGDDYVDRANSSATEFDSDFQRWITESAWAGVWDRPHLDRRTKSLITIAILASLGNEEFDLHLKAAIRNGASPTDIGEALMHVAVYAGLPAANAAFKRAKAILESI